MHRIFRVKAYEAGDLQLNFRYLIYYNKCNNVYQLVNAYPANITAPSA